MSLINQINLLAKRIAKQFKGLHAVATSGSYVDLKNKPTIPSIVTMKGASASAAGTAGYVPAPAAGKQTQFLRGDGTWAAPSQSTISGNAGSATKLATARYINGISFNGTANITNYGTCATVAATNPKIVTCANFALKSGSVVWVKFSVTNTVAGTADVPLQLNVNNTGAKNVYYHGSTVIGAGYFSANRVIGFLFDGTNFHIIGDFDNNTRYGIANYKTLGLIKPNRSYTIAATLTTAAATSATAVTVNAITTTASRYYAVEMDKNGVAFVNVPWVNNTYVNMKGASASTAGSAGLVPAPAAGAQSKFLRGDGTWQAVLTSVAATTVQKWATDPVTYFDSIYNK